MLKIGKDSNLGPSEVIDKAVAFFGPSGAGMKILEQADCCARFQGAGGYVSVRITDRKDGDGSKVTVEGREWEYQIQQFAGEI